MAEALDPRYSPQPSLQEGFLDKDTGLPLAFGLVYFYKNQSRTVLKPVFTLQEAVPGGPVNYVPLPNPVVLSGIGTIQDANGNDVIPYFFPFDSAGNVELYFIRVTNASSVQQFTREAFPNITPAVIAQNEPLNFIANGQFLVHNTPDPNMPQLPNFNYGTATTKVKAVAPGGWTYEVSSTSTAFATDQVTFIRSTQFNSNETASPRYVVNIIRSTPSADTIVDLRIKFMDVFKFASTTQAYTFLFNAFSTNAPVNNVQVLTVDYYGTGGSPTATNEVPFTQSPIDVTTTIQQFAFTMVLPPNMSAILGTNDDDFIQFAIRMPGNQTFNISFTDFILVQGTVTAENFPVTTNGEFLESAVFNVAPITNGPDYHPLFPAPSYYSQDGSNLYLPLIMTSEGMTWDFSSIARIEGFPDNVGFQTGNTVHSFSNLLLCDGTTYVTSTYSPLGIPYSRLASVLWNNVANTFWYGNGANFANAIVYTSDNTLIKISTNKPGAQTAVADSGTNPTNMTFNLILTGNTTTNISSYVDGTTVAHITAIGNLLNQTALTAQDDGAHPTGFGVAQYQSSPGTRQVFLVNAATGLPTGGTDFRFGNTTTQFYVWYRVDGVAAPDPAPGGTGLLCNILSSYSTTDVARLTSDTINGYQVSNIKVTASPTASSFFTFTANGLNYNVWFQVAGNGTAPAPPSGANIKVTLTGAETHAQIATAIIIAINSYQFATPNFQGVFFRSLSSTNTLKWDPTPGIRFSPFVENINGNQIGTFEFYDLSSHAHPPTAGNFIIDSGNTILSSAGGVTWSASGMTGFAGGNETRPVNASLLYAIRY